MYIGLFHQPHLMRSKVVRKRLISLRIRENRFEIQDFRLFCNEIKKGWIIEILGLHDNTLLRSGNQLRNHRTAIEITNDKIGMQVRSKKLLAFSVLFKERMQTF